jgi:hypothetical protein
LLKPKGPIFLKHPWICLITTALIWAGGWVHWVSSTYASVLRMKLITAGPAFLWLGFAALVFALWLNREALSQLLCNTDRWTACALAAIAILGFVLVHFVAPRTHRLYYDEDIYQVIGLNIAQNNQAAMVNDGRWDFGHFRSVRPEYNKQPNGWPFLINLAYRVFGVSEAVSFNLTNVLFILAILLVFACSVLLFNSTPAGMFAAAIYATLPENVLWYSTAAVEPATACFMLLGIFALLFFLRDRSGASLVLLTTVWAFAVQFRPEVLLLLTLVGAVLYIKAWEEFTRPRLYFCATLFLILLSAHLAHLLSVQSETWGSSGDKFSLQYLSHNFKTNSQYYIDGLRFPRWASLMMGVGLFVPGRWKSKILIATWGLITWGVFLFFYAGSYQYGSDVRFALLSLAPIALLAGYGIFWLSNRGGVRTRPAILSVAVLIGSANLFPFAAQLRATGQEAWICRLDHDLAEEFARVVPEDGLVLTHNPNMFQLWGKNAAQLSLATSDPNFAAEVLNTTFSGKAYIHWNYWCNTQDPVQVRFCEDVLARFPTQVIEERNVRGKRFGLYRITGPAVVDAPKKASHQ